MELARCGETIFRRLKETYVLKDEDFITYYVYKATRDPFKALIATVLSQNSTDKVALRTFQKLESDIGVNPSSLYLAGIDRIKHSLKVGGLYNNKSRYIFEIAKYFYLKGEGWLDQILQIDPTEAKKILMSIDGIGEKTADVLILTVGMKPVFPVDTHIMRIGERMAVANRKSYRDISSGFMQVFRPEEYGEVHRLLIAHGRSICRARKPLCDSCVIRECCAYGTGKYRSS